MTAAGLSTIPVAQNLALDGIRVLDFSRVLAGPFCGALLADMGADVIKIEDPVQGDESRTWHPQKQGESAAYVVNNRNKRGIAVNLKTADGVALVKRLVCDADVLVENFRTGTMEAFGLGYDVLAEVNPRLIFSSITAFGRTGPLAEEGGYEALMQAFSGIMSITGEADGPPVRALRPRCTPREIQGARISIVSGEFSRRLDRASANAVEEDGVAHAASTARRSACRASAYLVL